MKIYKFLLIAGCLSATLIGANMATAQGHRVPSSSSSSSSSTNNNSNNNSNRPGYNTGNSSSGIGNRNNNNTNNKPAGNGVRVPRKPSVGEAQVHRPGGYNPPVNSGTRPTEPARRPGYNNSYNGNYNGNYYQNEAIGNRDYHSGYYCPPPVRPYRPIYNHIPRPIYPGGYQPYYSAPCISGVLGIAFGLTYVDTLDYLYNRGYSIDGYDEGQVYIRDVREMDYNWEDAILSYDEVGNFYGAQFINSVGYFNTSRFYNLYNRLTQEYGAPINPNARAGYDGTWFDRNGETYITLQFKTDRINGMSRYYTLLTYSYQ
ncbi:MAG: hypothetical protein PHR45_07735 [Muribaculaceae bacterium]|nr:hypothetical protein [Muribaculaceae bacterium]